VDAVRLASTMPLAIEEKEYVPGSDQRVPSLVKASTRRWLESSVTYSLSETTFAPVKVARVVSPGRLETRPGLNWTFWQAGECGAGTF
jgi:hypothetical protein